MFWSENHFLRAVPIVSLQFRATTSFAKPIVANRRVNVAVNRIVSKFPNTDLADRLVPSLQQRSDASARAVPRRQLGGDEEV